jgi:hypothetical protein
MVDKVLKENGIGTELFVLQRGRKTNSLMVPYMYVAGA